MARSVDDILKHKLADLTGEHTRLCAELEDPAVLADHKAVRARSMRKAEIDAVVADAADATRVKAEIAELAAAVKANTDKELVELAKEELPLLAAKLDATNKRVRKALVLAEDDRINSVIFELRAGTGGDEAALWASDLLTMYQRYAAGRAWQFEVLDVSTESDAGGIRSATVNIRGQGVWSVMLFEAGVHSVKRVPATEAQGRIHTSTATVAVLPEPETIDIKIDWAKDVEETVTTSQGPGGQNVNKVATAVQMHHKPSGIIIRMQESKSQQQNRERAKRLLATKLYELERQRKHAERTAARSAQIGGGERSEKIRTYRFKEGIVADERLPGEYRLEKILNGELDEIFNDLTEVETARRLEAL